jgi:hypothetical protein
MLFDFNASISGYALGDLQIAVAALVGDQGREPRPKTSGLQSVVGGEVQTKHASLVAMHKAATWG